MYKNSNSNSNYISFLIKEAISPGYLESKLSKIKDILAASGIRRIKRFSPAGSFYTSGINSIINPRGGFAKMFPRSGNKNLARIMNNLGTMHEYNEAKTMKGVLRGKGKFDLSTHTNLSVPKTDLLYLNVLKKKYPELEGYYSYRKNEIDKYNKIMREYASTAKNKKIISNALQEKAKAIASRDQSPTEALKEIPKLMDMTPSGIIKLIRSTFAAKMKG